jgi:hypothetical protein
MFYRARPTGTCRPESHPTGLTALVGMACALAPGRPTRRFAAQSSAGRTGLASPPEHNLSALAIDVPGRQDMR